jgi:hypothetical protein
MNFSKSSLIKWSGIMLAVALIAAVTLVLYLQTAHDAIKGLLGAIAISGFAGGAALIPILYAVSQKPSLTQMLSLAAGGIRLLFTFVGSVIICFLINVNILWLIGWTAIFYLMVLVMEIRIAICVMDLNKVG